MIVGERFHRQPVESCHIRRLEEDVHEISLPGILIDPVDEHNALLGAGDTRRGSQRASDR